MARTPLLRSLVELARNCARAEGAPPDEIPLSRRDFLSAAVVGTAGVLLDLPPAVARARSRQRIVVVGGGISGLTAALRLTDAGIACELYEGSGRLGGRIFSNSPGIARGAGYWEDGQVSEWGGELIDSGHHTVRVLAHRFQLALDDVRSARPRGSRDTLFFFGDYYEDAARDFRELMPALKRDAEEAGSTTDYRHHTPGGIALDRMSIHEWIETRVPGGHYSRLGRLLDVAYTIEYGADTRDQSALNLVYLLSGSPSAPFEVFGQSDERYHLRGGNQRLPLEIARALPSGTVRTGRKLTSLERRQDGKVTLTFASGSGSEVVIADRVILTVPFAVLRTLDLSRAGFDARKRSAIRELGAGRNGKLMVQFRSRRWNAAGPWGTGTGSSFTDLGYQASWDVSRAQPGSSGILVGYTGGSGTAQYDQRSPFTTSGDPVTAAAARRQVEQMDEVFPGLGELYNGKANLSLPFRNPYFQCSYSYWRVGQYHRFAGYERVAQGNIHFAGEHCSQDFQGYMEGAAAEGLRAANEVLHAVRRG